MQANELDELQKLLNLKLKDLQLIKQAFIHRSYLNEVKLDVSSNERLEFLGDAILSLIISYNLYTKRPNDAEGKLTNLRSYIVRTKSLAEAAKKLKLGEYLKLSKGEEFSGGRKNPQLLANTYEALLGAVFLDSGMKAAEKMVERTLLSLFTSELKQGPPKDAKSLLQELVQEKLKKSPSYKTLATRGPDHARQFLVGVYIGGKVYGRGKGSSKQEAESKAAEEGLKRLTTS